MVVAVLIDSALHLASTVRCFEDDANVDPPYNVILSSFWECFDLNGALYRRTRGQAFISGKAIVLCVFNASRAQNPPRSRP